LPFTGFQFSNHEINFPVGGIATNDDCKVTGSWQDNSAANGETAMRNNRHVEVFYSAFAFIHVFPVATDAETGLS